MSSETNYMNWGYRISLIISVLSFLVAFVGLTLSDSVSDLIEKADVLATQDSTKLDGLADSNGYIDVLNFRNRGNVASKNINLVIDFESELPAYKLSSDEDIGGTDVDGRRLRVRMDRLSVSSSLKITMFSKFPIIYDASYIDDSGKHKISVENDTAQQSLIDIILLIVIIVSLLAIVWIYRRVSESALIDTLQNHQNEIQERLREVRDEIGNIEVVVREPGGSVVDGANNNDKGFSQRLADLINKI